MSVSSALKSILAFKFEILSGPHAGQKFSFDKAVVTLGRGTENDVSLNEDPKISRSHIEIKYFNGEFRVTNLSQKNFTLVNGRKIDNSILNYGDKILIGDTEIVFNLNQPENVAPSQSAVAPDKTLVAKSPVTPMKPKAPLAQVPPMMPQGPPPMPPPSFGQGSPAGSPSPGFSQNSGRARFYIIVAVVGLLLYFLFSDSGKKKEEPIRFDAPSSIQKEVSNAETLKRNLEEKKQKMENLQARRAEENFLKGFRDFRQGQYARAKDAFQVVLTLNPDHLEARRYLTLSKLKFDEQVKQYLQQGRLNFENRNFRLCKSNFLTVITMLSHNPNDPSYIDAKKFYDACDLALIGGGR